MNAVCELDGCEKPQGKRDKLCPMHRARYRATGNYDGVRIKTCEGCGKEYEAAPARGRQVKFCSNDCRQNAAVKRRPKPKAEHSQEYRLRSRYGITRAEFDQMYEDQEGRCEICGESPDRLYIDHDHTKTGKESVRALLCWHCNSGLGHFRDDPERLSAAAEYVTRF